MPPARPNLAQRPEPYGPGTGPWRSIETRAGRFHTALTAESPAAANSSKSLPSVPGAEPDWLPALALAGDVTPVLIELVATTFNHPRPPEGWTGVAAQLQEAGVLEPLAPGRWRVSPKVRRRLVERLHIRSIDPATLRSQLLRRGLAGEHPMLAEQFALWARQNRDWQTLSHVWVSREPGFWLQCESATTAFGHMPAVARRRHPALGHANALLAGKTPTGCDRSIVVHLLMQEGQLHAGWARFEDPDAMVRAGTMWMLAQSTLQPAGSPISLENARQTGEAISEQIGLSTRAGRPPSAASQSFFHAAASAQAILRGDFDAAGDQADLAVLLSTPGDHSGLVGAAQLGVISLWTGDVPRLRNALSWYDSHAEACGPAAGIAAPIHALAQAMIALRRLDREQAKAHLSAIPVSQRGHDLWSLVLAAKCLYELLWVGADEALALFDAATNGQTIETESTFLEALLLTRVRAEILLAIGRINQAGTLLQKPKTGELRKLHLVPWARLFLCAGDWERAIATASQGLYSASVTLPDRAHLHVIKAAALLADGGDSRVVQQAMAAACGICSKSAELTPIALLPATLREALLNAHGHSSPEHTNCPLIAAIDRAQLADRNAYPNSSRLITLTPRERELLPLLATSDTFEQIASRLHVSANTVRNQVVTLRAKLGAANRRELVARADESGLLRSASTGRRPTNKLA